MAVDINISLQLKGDTSVELQVSDEAKKIIQADSSSPIITFVATGEKGEQGVAGTALLSAGSINHTHLATDSVGTNAIISGSVGYNEITAGAIRGSKIQADAITTEKILDGAVTSAKLATGLITDAVVDVIEDGVITGPKIKDLEIGHDKIKDGAITAQKLGIHCITAVKIQNKTITGEQVTDNIVLGGTTHVTAIQVDGSSPGYIYGPADDTFYVQSHKDLIFKCDSDQSSNPDTSFFRFQNAGNTNLLTLDESGNAVLAGNLTLSGNIVVNGTVDGVNVAESISATTAQLTKVNYISVTQPVDLDAMETKLDGITDNEAIDWTTDQGGTNIHAGNYTDTNTQLSTEEVQDIVGAMFTSNTETRVSATYDDTDGTIDLVADDMTADTNTQLTDEQVQDIVGAMVDGGTETNISVTYDDTSGKLNFASTDTNTTYSEATSSDAGLMSTAHHDKLDGIATGAEVNVQSDWNSSSGDSQILNKPTIPVDLTTDGAGTIHANNVGTLNQDTTGNAATATNLTAGDKTIAGKITAKGLLVDANISVTPSGDGAAVHVDAMDVTDNNTSASGTATTYNHITFENPRLLASNSSVTTTNASTFYIKGAPVASTNQTITNAYSIYVQGGSSYFGGDTYIAGNVIGNGSTTISGIDTITATGIITGKQRQIYQQSFIDDLGANNRHYLPWRDTDEQTTIYQEEAAMIAPYDGRIVSVTMRISSVSGTGTRTLGIHTLGPNTSQFSTSNWTEEETEDASISSTDDNHVFYFVFDNAKHFESGELVTLSIIDDTDLTSGQRYTYISTVVEWDYNNGLGTGSSSAEYDSAQ